MTQQDNFTEEDYLYQQIRILQESYEKAAKPYVDRLIQIKSFRAGPITVSKEDFDKFQQGAQLPEAPL